jgi:hypothetical protein
MEEARVAEKSQKKQPLSNGYELFILLMTVLSLLDMVALFWPGLTPATKQLLLVYDNAACLLFLLDFSLR